MHKPEPVAELRQAAGSAVSLGRGLNICVGIPFTALDATQLAQIHDLVRGVNETEGKY